MIYNVTRACCYICKCGPWIQFNQLLLRFLYTVYFSAKAYTYTAYSIKVIDFMHNSVNFLFTSSAQMALADIETKTK